MKKIYYDDTQKRQRAKLFRQLVGKLKSFGGNYVQYCWNFVDAEMNEPYFMNDSNYEISGGYLKSGNPLLIDTEVDE